MLRRMLPFRRRSRVEFEVSAATFEALALGAISGLRSMAAPALLSQAIRRGDIGGLRGATFDLLSEPRVSAALRLLMVGEMLADKAPFAPDRTLAPALAWRLLSGGLVGAAMFASEGRRQNSGAVLGALSALAASYAGERVRKTASAEPNTAGGTVLSNAVLGAIEDRLVLTLGTRVLRRRG